MADNNFNIDKRLARKAFSKAADKYELASALQQEVETRLLERLDLVRLKPKRVLDLGCGTGRGSHALLARYPKTQLVSQDIALGMLGHARKRGRWLRRPICVCADAEHLPFPDKHFDLVFSNLMLQWCTDIDAVFREVQRVLKPGGLLMFTTFGPDTLLELRKSWAAVDGYTHVNVFMDMHDMGDALLRCGFAEPVMDVERLTVTYKDVRHLMRDLKQIGAHNITQGRLRGLTGKQHMQAFINAYEQYRSDGLLPASYEVVNGHAWAPDTSVSVTLDRLQRP
jgi:malonyl-CoA O-methyltransferase